MRFIIWILGTKAIEFYFGAKIDLWAFVAIGLYALVLDVWTARKGKKDKGEK